MLPKEHLSEQVSTEELLGILQQIKDSSDKEFPVNSSDYFEKVNSVMWPELLQNDKESFSSALYFLSDLAIEDPNSRKGLFASNILINLSVKEFGDNGVSMQKLLEQADLIEVFMNAMYATVIRDVRVVEPSNSDLAMTVCRNFGNRYHMEAIQRVCNTVKNRSTSVDDVRRLLSGVIAKDINEEIEAYIDGRNKELLEIEIDTLLELAEDPDVNIRSYAISFLGSIFFHYGCDNENRTVYQTINTKLRNKIKSVLENRKNDDSRKVVSFAIKVLKGIE